MTPKQFEKHLALQPYCPHCGDTETLVPQHRASRGAGSPKSLNRPANIMVLCALMNGLIESDAKAAQTARRYGWKISKYQNPTEEPYFDLIANQWFLLGDDYTKGALQV